MSVKKNKNVTEGVTENEIIPVKTPKRVTVITAVVVFLVIILNIAVTMIGDARLWYIDLTSVRYKSGESTMYTLSDACLSLIGKDAVPMIEKVNAERARRGEEPIKLNIIFCADKDHIENDSMMRYLNMTARTLEKEYANAIDVQYININKDPSAVQRFKTTSAAKIYNSDVIVEFGSEYLVQKISSFYYQDEGKSTPWAYIGEQRLSAMILSLTRAEAPICAITTNHGESLFDGKGEVREDYSEFIKIIGGAGYEVVFIDLEKDEIPENCRMMITFDPRDDFKAYGDLGENGVSEIEKLDRYLEESNAFFYVCDRETPKLNNLEEYLEEWGIAVERAEDGAALEENFAVRDQVNCTDTGRGDIVTGKYGKVGLAAGITGDLQKLAFPPMVVFPNATSIAPSDSYTKTFIPEDKDNGVEAGSYFSYYRNGVSRTFVEVFSSFDTASAYIGGEVYEIATEPDPFRYMTVSRESRSIQETNYTSIDKSSFVYGVSSTDFFKNELLASAAYGNCDVLLSALRQSGTEEMPANIKLKAFYVYEMDGIEDETKFTEQGKIWTLCLALIPTAVALVTGAVIVIRRKTR